MMCTERESIDTNLENENLPCEYGERVQRFRRYVYRLASFNLHYKTWMGSDIGLFDNCSWKAYKRSLEEEKRHEL